MPWEHIAREAAHRPWPAPDRPWVLAQTWRNLLFAHWPVPAAALRPRLPRGLDLDTYDGDAWVGLVPFHLSHIAPRGVPRGRGLAFPELNLRTYVVAGEKPGVWFFSLDAASLPAVVAARVGLQLPYYWARIRMHDDAGWIAFASQRRLSSTAMAAFVARYQPIGPIVRPEPGSLDDWLTARYCLYSACPSGRLIRVEVQHLPWPLQPAAADISVNSVPAAHGLDLTGAPLLHFSRHLDVVAWPPERVSSFGNPKSALGRGIG